MTKITILNGSHDGDDERGWSYQRCVPDPSGSWEIEEDGIYLRRGTERKRITSQPIYIEAREIDIDTKLESITVAWEDGTRIRRLTSPRRSLSTPSGVLNLADMGYAVNFQNARQIVEYITHLLDYQRNIIPIRHMVSSCGTKKLNGTEVFVVGNSVICGADDCPEIAFNPQMDGDGIIGNLNSRKDGDLAKWTAVAREIGEYPMAAFGVAASFLPPLLKDLGISQNPIIDYGGKSSTGKTTVLKFCASVWGYPLESDGGLVRSWSGTEVFFERYAAIMNELPIFLDESHKANVKQACNTLYQYSNGTGRGRGSLKGIQRNTRYRGVMFSAGEARLTDVGRTSGVHARVIGFWDSPFGKGKRDLVGRINRVSEKHYGLAGKKVLQEYLRHRERLLPKLKVMHKSTSERLAGLTDDNIGQRLANYFGAIYAAGKLANSVLGLEWDIKHIVDEAFRIVFASRPPSIAKEAIELVGEWIASNRAKFEGVDTTAPSGEPVGRIFTDRECGEERIAIPPNVIHTLLRQHDYPYNSVITQWLDNGWLEVDAGRLKKKVRFNYGSAYMVVLNQKGIAASSGETIECGTKSDTDEVEL